MPLTPPMCGPEQLLPHSSKSYVQGSGKINKVNHCGLNLTNEVDFDLNNQAPQTSFTPKNANLQYWLCVLHWEEPS